ncbi:MAG: spore germination protein, partial [Clostridia bacterium]|nr:spore germination protein [Clostridia bacterium]
LYMAFVSIAGFAQQNIELGYAFKFVRMITLILVSILDIWGFVLGMLLFVVLIATNKTVSGRRNYLYPLIPFDPKALAHLLIRTPKRDFDEKKEEKRERQG